MKTFGATAKLSHWLEAMKRRRFKADDHQSSCRAARSLLAAFLAGALGGGASSTAFAQSPAQNPPSNASAAPQTSTIAPVSSLGLAKHDFTHGPKAFPDLIKPYQPIQIEAPLLTNSPRIDQLIHDGKLQLSLQDAIELALENSLDIAVQRYYPWAADTDILKTAAGGFGRGTPGASLSSSSANLPTLSYDSIVTGTILLDDRTTPVNNPFISGTATTSFTHLVTHTDEYNTQFSRGFETGANLTVSWNNTRSSSTSTANFFNPAVQSTLTVGFSQQLLNGFGLYVNRRNIMIAKNNRKVADWAFAQQAISTVTNTITAYWELVYARENVRVEEQAVSVSEKLYSDNKKQLGVGTMAPLDVTRAQSELATDRQNLIVARTVQLQDEQILKNAITKDPMAPNLVNVEIIPSDEPTPPEAVENPSFEESVKEAYAKRPELQEQFYNLQNGEIDVRATANALRPVLTLSGQYSSVGLAGNSLIEGTPPIVSSGVPIVDANGNPITVVINGVSTPIFEPANGPTPILGTKKEGFGNAQSDIFHNRFPDYSAQLTLTLPLRNRSAQADNARAILEQRQLETQMQQLKNAALLDVRNSYIALTQDRAQVDAATEARKLQQETFDAEQKKYRLGASTVYNVILTQRDLIAAQGTELRALANLQEAKANYERALGRTLDVNHVTIADALSGQVERETLIPGTIHGKVVGTDELSRNSALR
ncbi:MAG TPA: TolC family protein [Candidatus Acidoferrum sp.]|nr:TolC family protein [Candidatus Acidoferrum sp.]